jgi:hypothetical protein
MFGKFFGTDPSASMMRLGLILSVLSGIIIAFIIVLRDQNMSTGAVLVGTLVGPAFAGKAIQAFAEKNSGGLSNDPTGKKCSDNIPLRAEDAKRENPIP